MKSRKLKVWFVLSIVLIFICLAGTRLLKVKDKDALFLDEYFTVMLANYLDYGCSIPFLDQDNVFTGKELKSIYMKDAAGMEDIVYDLFHLWKNTRDISHSNFYYSIMRCAFFHADTSDISDIVFRGMLVNMICFALSFFFMFKILWLLSRDYYVTILMLIVIFASAVSLSGTLYLRRYQLEECLLIAFTYFFIKQILEVKDLGRLCFTRTAVFFIVSSALTLWVDYLTGFYVCIVWLSLLVFMLLKKLPLKDFAKLVGFGLLAIGILCLLYPIYFIKLFQALKAGGLNNEIPDIPNRWLWEIDFVENVFLPNTLGVVGVLLIIFCLFLFVFRVLNRKKNESVENSFFNYNLLAIVALMAIFSLIMVRALAPPYQILRYVYPYIGLILLLIPALLSRFSLKIKYAFLFAFLCVTLIQSFMTKEFFWEKVDLNGYKEDVSTPLLVYQFFDAYLQADLLPYYTDDRVVEQSFELETLIQKIDKYKEVYVAIPKRDTITLSTLQSLKYSVDTVGAFDKAVYSKGYRVSRKIEE